jgi:hypothetical protein
MQSPWAAALVVAAGRLYWPSLSAGFVGDDFMILHHLRGIHVADVLRFFRTEFFEYYRPLGFLSHAVDWSIGGTNPLQFHLTNLVLHATSAVLVLLIGRALSPQSPAGLIAALLFAIHASNNEAVLWVSARFDLLATCFALAAIYCLSCAAAGSSGSGRCCSWPPRFPESAVALPIAVAAWWAVRRDRSTVGTVTRLAPWLSGLVLCAILRHLGGGRVSDRWLGRLPALCTRGGRADGRVAGRWSMAARS